MLVPQLGLQTLIPLHNPEAEQILFFSFEINSTSMITRGFKKVFHSVGLNTCLVTKIFAFKKTEVIFFHNGCQVNAIPPHMLRYVLVLKNIGLVLGNSFEFYLNTPKLLLGCRLENWKKLLKKRCLRFVFYDKVINNQLHVLKPDKKTIYSE